MRITHNLFVQTLGRPSPTLIPVPPFVPVVLSPLLKHGMAAVLNFSERRLNREQLYVDVIDVDPPLIYVLNRAPRILGAGHAARWRSRCNSALPRSAPIPGSWPSAPVVVDKKPGIPCCGGEFSFIAYFTRYPLFAEIWSQA